MKKEKFKYLYSFKYKNKKYIYLVSKNCPFYFLEYIPEKNNFDYPNIETFKELYNKFYSDNNVLSFDLKFELLKLKEKLTSMTIELPPFIRTASGLISIAMVLSMCGCSQTNEMLEITEPTSSIVETQDKSKEIYEYFKQYNMEVIDKDYDGNDYIFVQDFINSKNKHQITLQNFNEFRQYNQMEFIPTWQDVIEAFKGNQNIDDEKKSIILEGINNLMQKEELQGMDLSVLYVNAKRMSLRYITSDEMINDVNRDSVYAYFDPTTGEVTLPSDKPLAHFEFIHEVLGHGALAYRDETEDTLTVFDCTNYLMLPTDERYTGYSVGVMVSEGGANMIAHLATDDYSVSNFYELYEEELRTISALCDVSLGELFNHKGIAMYDLMYKNGINTPIEYIFYMDGIYKGQLYCEFSDLMERLLVDATEEEFTSATSEMQDAIISSTVQIIRDSYFNTKDELSYAYPGGTINYNFEETVNDYQENMNQLRSSK